MTAQVVILSKEKLQKGVAAMGSLLVWSTYRKSEKIVACLLE
jgi:hypothetical protein